MFTRLAQQHKDFVQDLVMNLQALAIVLENRNYLASCYTCGGQMNSASFLRRYKCARTLFTLRRRPHRRARPARRPRRQRRRQMRRAGWRGAVRAQALRRRCRA